MTSCAMCAMLPSTGACLSHTCPDCGAFGRYGHPISHLPGCSPEPKPVPEGPACEGDHPELSEHPVAEFFVYMPDSDSAANGSFACGRCALAVSDDPDLVVERLDAIGS